MDGKRDGIKVMNEPGEKCEHASARATLCSLLAQALNYPDRDLVDSLCRGEYLPAMLAALKALGIPGPEKDLKALQKACTAPKLDRAALLLEIEKDYTWMCFASKPHRLVYLFESVYNEGKLYDESTFAIARLYYEAGLKLDEDFRLPPDHIAVELEFMAFLSFKEMEGLKTGDARIADYAALLQKKTLDEHLRNFALNVAERLGRHAGTSFYRGIARVMTAYFSHPT